MTDHNFFGDAVEGLREMVGMLPMESPSVRERRDVIDAISRPNYWLKIDGAKARVLNLEVAPLMRFLSGVDVNAMTFEIHCLEAVAALLDVDADELRTCGRKVREDLIRLPLTHPDVDPFANEVQSYFPEDSCDALTADDITGLLRRYASLMRLRQNEPDVLIQLDLEDAFQEQRWIAVGPHAAVLEVSEYQTAVTLRLQELAVVDDVFRRVAAGELPDAEGLAHIAATLEEPELYAIEATLQKAWRAPHVSLLSIIRHALQVEPFSSREDAIREVTETFIASKGFLQSDQFTLVRLLARRSIDAGRVRSDDLLEPPFTSVTTDAEALIGESDLAEILALLGRFEVDDA